MKSILYHSLILAVCMPCALVAGATEVTTKEEFVKYAGGPVVPENERTGWELSDAGYQGHRSQLLALPIGELSADVVAGHLVSAMMLTAHNPADAAVAQKGEALMAKLTPEKRAELTHDLFGEHSEFTVDWKTLMERIAEREKRAATNASRIAALAAQITQAETAKRGEFHSARRAANTTAAEGRVTRQEARTADAKRALDDATAALGRDTQREYEKALKAQQQAQAGSLQATTPVDPAAINAKAWTNNLILANAQSEWPADPTAQDGFKEHAEYVEMAQSGLKEATATLAEATKKRDASLAGKARTATLANEKAQKDAAISDAELHGAKARKKRVEAARYDAESIQRKHVSAHEAAAQARKKLKESEAPASPAKDGDAAYKKHLDIIEDAQGHAAVKAKAEALVKSTEAGKVKAAAAYDAGLSKEEAARKAYHEARDEERTRRTALNKLRHASRLVDAQEKLAVKETTGALVDEKDSRDAANSLLARRTTTDKEVTFAQALEQMREREQSLQTAVEELTAAIAGGTTNRAKAEKALADAKDRVAGLKGSAKRKKKAAAQAEVAKAERALAAAQLEPAEAIANQTARQKELNETRADIAKLDAFLKGEAPKSVSWLGLW